MQSTRGCGLLPHGCRDLSCSGTVCQDRGEGLWTHTHTFPLNKPLHSIPYLSSVICHWPGIFLEQMLVWFLEHCIGMTHAHTFSMKQTNSFQPLLKLCDMSLTRYFPGQAFVWFLEHCIGVVRMGVLPTVGTGGWAFAVMLICTWIVVICHA